MKELKLESKDYLRAWKWTAKDGLGVQELGILPEVNSEGQTTYYLNGEWLQEGVIIIELEPGKFRVFPPEYVEEHFKEVG